MNKHQIIVEVQKIHKLVNMKSRLEIFEVLNKIEHITFKVLTSNGHRAVKHQSNKMGA